MGVDEDVVLVPATETEADEEMVGAALVALELDPLVVLELDPCAAELVALVPLFPSASPVPVPESPVSALCVQYGLDWRTCGFCWNMPVYARRISPQRLVLRLVM